MAALNIVVLGALAILVGCQIVHAQFGPPGPYLDHPFHRSEPLDRPPIHPMMSGMIEDRCASFCDNPCATLVNHCHCVHDDLKCPPREDNGCPDDCHFKNYYNMCVKIPGCNVQPDPNTGFQPPTMKMLSTSSINHPSHPLNQARLAAVGNNFNAHGLYNGVPAQHSLPSLMILLVHSLLMLRLLQ